MLHAHVPRGTASARLLLELGLEQGLTVDDCLQATALCVDILEDPLGEIAVTQELQLIQNLICRLSDRPGLGLEAGIRYRIALFGILGFACMSAPRLRDIIDISLRYQDLTFTLAKAEIIRQPTATFISADASHLPHEVRRFVVDQCLATIWTTVSDLSESPPPPRLELAYDSAPRGIERYRDVFGVEPALGSPTHRIGFANRYLEQPRAHADLTALGLCEQGCRDLLARRQRQVGTSGVVRDRLSRAHGTVPTMEVIAADLHMSPRTLRRALLEEGTSFRVLDEVVRRQRAGNLLASGMPIEQIATDIGYSSSSGFVHAFKRWHGISPGAFRARAARTTARAAEPRSPRIEDGTLT